MPKSSATRERTFFAAHERQPCHGLRVENVATQTSVVGHLKLTHYPDLAELDEANCRLWSDNSRNSGGHRSSAN